MPETSGGDLTCSTVSDPLARHSATPSELQELIVADRAGTPYLALRNTDRRLQLRLLDAEAQRVLTIGRRPDSDRQTKND